MESKELKEAGDRLEAAMKALISEAPNVDQMARFIHQSAPIEFAKILAYFPPGSAEHHLAQLAWQQQLADRQIAAARSSNWRSIIGGVIAVLLGVIAGRWHSLEAGKQQIINMSGVESAQTQRKTTSQAGQQQPVAAPPPKQTTILVTPTNQLPTPKP